MTLQILGELLGTFILVLLGNGVVAANVLGKTKSENAGWVTIAIGWGWGYAWIPATGSIVGAVIAGLLYQWMLTLH